MIDLRLGDCLELMRDLETGSVDAVITDPPYGINYNPKRRRGAASIAYARGEFDRNWDGIEGDKKPFDPSPLLSFPKAILFGANYYADKLPPSGGWVFWDKKKCKGFISSAGELIWTNASNRVLKFEYMWDGFRREGEVGEHYHPTQKPLALMEYLIREFTKEGDTVLDPFMGSGTTGVACAKLGRNFIGMEINPDYYAIAQRRIAEAQLQMPLALPV